VTESTPIIALHGASKSYGAVRALREADVALRAGEVRGLVGENGAGKSTLVRLLAGVQRPDSGVVLVDGQEVDLHSTADARDAGVAVIFQEPTLFPDLSVAENVVMGRHPLQAMRRIDRRAMRREVAGLLERLGVRLDPDRPVRGLSIADQQIVEIAKALSYDARVLIMDEPTAALSGWARPTRCASSSRTGRSTRSSCGFRRTWATWRAMPPRRSCRARSPALRVSRSRPASWG
jgi:rhamnose transport system ATP-binding protein